MLRWHIIFNAGFVGPKSLWARVEDLGDQSTGFTNSDQITLTAQAKKTPDVSSASAPAS